MVNFRDPVEIAQDQLAVTRLWHATAGLYMWEFVITLDYEWSIIRGDRPYRWTIWIYCLTRVAALISVILSLVGNDVPAPYNCEIQTIFQFGSGYLAVASASLLMVLRMCVTFFRVMQQCEAGTTSIAIWNKKKIITAVAITVWMINVPFLIHGITRIHGAWTPDEATCLVLDIESNKPNFIVTLCTDIVLLVIMLIGCFVWAFMNVARSELDASCGDRCGVDTSLRPGCSLSTDVLLIFKGLIWLVIATLAEVPPMVFLCLNLNNPYNHMFMITSMVAISIGATRIHRQLVDFVSVRSDVPNNPDCFQINRLMSSKPASFFPQNHMGMAIHATCEQYSRPPPSHSDSFMTAEEQFHDNTAGLGLARDDDVEKRGPA
ncbi:hypothetical protein BC827DRAFT_1270892 [Russula dissimulans]|nr:hypothetical protein BC827DRAFT_1270892 [Russula dissimulans]